MEATVPALPTIRAGEGDVLPGIHPGHLIALVLHELDEALTVIDVLQRLVDGVDQIQLPAVAPQTSLILTGPHLLFAGTLLRRLQHTETVSDADLIIDFPVLLKVIGVLMELPAINMTDAVDYQVVVQMIGVDVGGDQYLEVRELSLGELDRKSVV